MPRTIFKIFEKIRLIRYQEGFKRKEFSELVNIPLRTLEGIENKGTDPRSSYVQSICKKFPEYTLWFMLDEVDIDSGQISPMIKGYWRKHYRFLGDKSEDDLKDMEEGKVIFDRGNKSQIEEVKHIIEKWHGGDTDVEYSFHSTFFGDHLD